MKSKLFPIILTVALIASIVVNAILSILLVSSKNTELVKSNQVLVLQQENAELRTSIADQQTQDANNSTGTPQQTTSTAPDSNTTVVDESTNSYSSALFDLKFNFDKSMGSASSASTKTVYTSNGTLFCLTERISFGLSALTLTLTKGYPECFGATGVEVKLREETVKSLDGKDFKFTVTGHSNSAQVDLNATYTSLADQYRGIKVEASVDTSTEITTEETQLKQIISTMSYNETKMLSETTENTISNN